MRSILCSMSLSVVAQKERKTYRRRRDILRGVRFFVSDLFQKRPSWRGAAVAGPFCLQKKKKKKKKEKRDEKVYINFGGFDLGCINADFLMK